MPSNCYFVPQKMSRPALLAVILGLFIVSFEAHTLESELNNVTVVPVVGHLPARLIIFKLPRSGSTWFVEELNGVKGVHVSEEALSVFDPGQFSRARKEAFLRKALRIAVGKIGEGSLRRASEGPEWNVLGFSVGFGTPSTAKDKNLDWPGIIASASNVQVVKYTRTNAVKWAVAILRDSHIVNELCTAGGGGGKGKGDGGRGGKQGGGARRGSRTLAGAVNNVEKGSSCQRRVASLGALPMSPSAFVSGVLNRLKALEGLDRFVASAVGSGAAGANVTAAPPAQFYEVSYEALQGNLQGTLAALFRHLGAPFSGPRRSELTKLTPDDLRLVISNFEQLRGVLAAGNATCLVEMLEAEGPRQFLRCNLGREQRAALLLAAREEEEAHPVTTGPFRTKKLSARRNVTPKG